MEAQLTAVGGEPEEDGVEDGAIDGPQLAAAGLTVWVTGRSTRAGGTTSHRPGYVEQTPEAVTAAAGTASPRSATTATQVRAVVERKCRTGPAAGRGGTHPVART
jgi:hypothetical protein